jgi:hypothetical protein
MDAFINLRGYAVPFLQTARNGGRDECFEPGAFDSMLASPHRAFLNFGFHGAPAICSPVSFHCDQYGIGFAASVSTGIWRSIKQDVVNGGHQYASIRTTDEYVENVCLGDGSPCASIVRARISHVCITDRPIYMGTGVWPADGGELNPRLARLACKWNAGRAQWLDEHHAHSRRRAAVRAYLAPRQATYAAMRMKWDAAFAADRHPDGIWGHVCFTQAGGFDGDFAKLIRARR